MSLTITLLLALLAGPPTPPPAAPVHTLEIAKGERLYATLTLPNHNTVLFIPALKSSKVRVVALAPSGIPTWQATLPKAQVVRAGGIPGLTSGIPTDESLITTLPLLMTSAENTVYTVEPISDGSPEKGLPQHALVVQSISPTGEVTGKVFQVPAPPAKTERIAINAFAEPGVVYVLASENNLREDTQQLFLDRCDLSTGKLTQLPLNLPAPTKVRHGGEFGLNWVYAGVRNGACHFYRALRGADASADARHTPVEFEVKRISAVDGHDLGGFITKLHANLPDKRYVQGTTDFPHTGAAQAPLKSSDIKGVNMLRGFMLETGGDCEVLLDEATGDYLFAGQYTDEIAWPGNGDLPSLGSFVQRYSPNGTLVKAAIAPYATMPKFTEATLMAKNTSLLQGQLLRASLTNELTMQFRMREGVLTSSFDDQLTPRPAQVVSFAGHKSYWVPVQWSGPSYLETMDRTTTGRAQRSLYAGLLQAALSETNRKIGQLVAAHADDKANKDTPCLYTASATGPTSALVLAIPYWQGRAVRIYAIK